MTPEEPHHVGGPCTLVTFVDARSIVNSAHRDAEPEKYIDPLLDGGIDNSPHCESSCGSSLVARRNPIGPLVLYVVNHA